jgi:hypothetical protein
LAIEAYIERTKVSIWAALPVMPGAVEAFTGSTGPQAVKQMEGLVEKIRRDRDRRRHAVEPLEVAE